MAETRLNWRAILVLLMLSLVWGANWAIVKLGSHDFAPLFMAGLRSLVGTICLLVWLRIKGLEFFSSKIMIWHGFVVGVLFASEFALIYVGLQYTLASRTYVLLYTAPFWAALGAHLFLKGDRLNWWKSGGLLLAFAGVVSLFLKGFGGWASERIIGDLMALAGGCLWGLTTIYVKRFLMGRAEALQVLFYHLFFSTPILFGLSLLLESQWVYSVTWVGLFSLFYQSIVVAFLSYLVWFMLVIRYPASLLHAFSYFTPVFGVFLSGAIVLEPLTWTLLLSLALVSVGMVLVNRSSPARKEVADDRGDA
jgi:drug/metabolite transporter (DMT)-like permease